jgi:hypothetical protein
MAEKRGVMDDTEWKESRLERRTIEGPCPESIESKAKDNPTTKSFRVFARRVSDGDAVL